MDTRTKEILNWLDEMATTFSLRLDKKQKALAEEAIKIIMKTTLAPVEEEQKFDIPPELERMTGSSVVSVETKAPQAHPFPRQGNGTESIAGACREG